MGDEVAGKKTLGTSCIFQYCTLMKWRVEKLAAAALQFNHRTLQSDKNKSYSFSSNTMTMYLGTLYHLEGSVTNAEWLLLLDYFLLLAKSRDNLCLPQNKKCPAFDRLPDPGYKIIASRWSSRNLEELWPQEHGSKLSKAYWDTSDLCNSAHSFNTAIANDNEVLGRNHVLMDNVVNRNVIFWIQHLARQ